jgi:group I intron endonuclease
MEAQLKKGKSAIYTCILKYGVSKFKLEILEYCSPAKCLKLEQKYINLLKPEYNISQVAAAPMFGRNHSEKTRAKMSAFRLAKTPSEETRAKISASLKGISLSEERKAKISASMMGKNSSKNQPSSLKLEVTDLEKNISTIFNSISEAARALKIAQPSISYNLKSKKQKPYKGRYVFTKI